MNNTYSSWLPRWLPRPLAALGLLLATVSAAQAQSSFGTSTTYAAGTGPLSLAVADLNGDGRPDVVTANQISNNVSVLFGQASPAGSLGTATNYGTGGTTPTGVALGDVNGDGRPDIVVVNQGSSTAAVLLNSASAPGTFLAAVTYGSGGSYPNFPVLADFNGDGRLDIAVGNTSSGTVGILLASANVVGTFGTATTYATGNSQFVGLTAGDLNRDGRPDLVTGGTNGNVAVLLNSTTTPGTFPAAVNYASGGNYIVGLKLGDVNGDANLDIVTGNKNSNNLSVLLGTTTGTFGTATLYSSGGSYINLVDLADVNGDNLLDIIAANQGSNNLGVLTSQTTPTGTFAPAATYASGGTGPIGVVAADLNGDGRRDLVVTNYTSGTVGVLLNTLAATAAPVLNTPANGVSTNGTPTFSGTAPTSSTVALYLTLTGGATQLLATVTATGGLFSYTPTTALVSGNYSACATAQSSGATVSANSNTNAFTVDVTPPTVLTFSLQSPTAALTNAKAVTYRVTFSEAVTGFTVSNVGEIVSANGSFNPGAITITPVSASVYDITLSPITGSGDIALFFATAAGITDLVGNRLSDKNTLSSPYYTIDQTPPTATLTTTASSPTSTAPIPFSVSFSEPVTGLSASSFTVFNGTVTSGPTSSGTNTYAFSVTPTGNGTVTVSLMANAVRDAVGNGNTASNAVSVQYTAPVASGISVQYQTGDFVQPTDGQVRPFLQLVNSGSTAVPYSSLTVRYWLTVENFMGSLVTPIDYAKLGTGFVSARYVALATPRQGAFGYIEYSFAAGAGNLAAGTNSGPIFGKAYKPDYSNFDETDDWSYQTSSSFTTNDHVTLYQNGTLIGGTEPPAVTATTALQVYAASRDASPSTSYVSVQLQARNTGNVPVNYSDVKLRYYFTRDGATAIVPELDYAKLGNGNITLRVVNLATAVSGADAYLEIGFSAALGVFYPRSGTDDILVKLRKDTYQAFDQTNDYSFSSATSLTLNDRITALVSNRLVFGTPPAGAPARMAASSASSTGATIVAASGPQALTASPNPFSEQLTLRFALPITQAYTLAVYDGQGRLVQQIASGEAAAEQAQEVAVPTQTYAAGLYLVRLTTASGVQTLKLVKQ